jgi:hypothetical protein
LIQNGGLRNANPMPESNFIHLDLSEGCTAESLVAALFDLADPSLHEELIGAIQESLCSADLALTLQIRDVFHAKRHGTTVDFLDSAGLLVASGFVRPSAYRARRSALKFAWVSKSRARRIKSQQAKTEKTDAELASAQAGLGNKDESPVAAATDLSSLEHLKSYFEAAELPAQSSHFLQRAFEHLHEAFLVVHGQHVGECALPATWIKNTAAHMISVARMIAELDPFSISATRIPLSFIDNSGSCSTQNDVCDTRGVMLHLARDLPVVERPWPAPYSNIAGLALLRALCSRFGVLGEGVIQKVGVGLSKVYTCGQPQLTRAFWCEAKRLQTRPSLGQDALPSADYLVELRCLLPSGGELARLSRELMSLAASQPMLQPVTQDTNLPRVLFTTRLPHSSADKAIALILASGNVSELTLHPVEQHALLKRTSSVAYGRGQSMIPCRVVEWLYGGRVLRADPLDADVQMLVKKTGFAPEVIRSDVLSAWRRWQTDNH